MARIQTTCPRCKAPIIADVNQLIDVSVDPQLKQKLLNGSLNVAHCQNCGYQGMLSVPLVYHDADKELLLTYFPPELGLSRNEQEKQIGPLITQVVNRLPAEKRKAYLFSPQTMLTFQTLVEKVLEGEGITKEMIEAQQQRLHLLQRLLTTQDENSRREIIRQEEANIDDAFFALLNRLLETGALQGDEQLVNGLAAIQQDAMELTDFGKQVKHRAEEAQEALKSLQEASKSGLTREKLLDLIIAAPTETRLNTLVSLARSGLDYAFFQILSERIDNADGDEKQRLTDLRQKLIEITSEIDKQVQARVDESRKVLQAIIQSGNVEQETQQRLGEIDEFFMEALNSELERARKESDLERIGKLQQVAGVLEKASQPPPEIALVETLLAAEDESARREILEKNAAAITPDFLQLLSTLVAQTEAQPDQGDINQRLQDTYRMALRFSMEQSLKQ